MRYGTCGLIFGDEGKGRVIDDWGALLRDPVIQRYNGGANAGHTIKVGGVKLVFHQIPSGISHRDAFNYVGGGTLFSPDEFWKDVATVEAAYGRGYVTPDRLGVSGRCFVVLDYHKQQDEAEERLREQQGLPRIGTTRQGIGPACEDIAARDGISVAEYMDADSFRFAVERVLRKKLALWGNAWPEPRVKNDDSKLDRDELPPDAQAYENHYGSRRKELAAFLRNQGDVDRDYRNRVWIYEGAQGAMLDKDAGIYPFVSTTPITRKPRTDMELGIMKVPPSSVGSRPLVTQMDPETETRFRERGDEFGATTGRPRQLCWPDLVIARYAADAQGITHLGVTKLDMLTGEPEIKLAVGYRLRGNTILSPPERVQDWQECEPIYETLPGWTEPIENLRGPLDLPREAQEFLQRLTRELHVPLGFFSYGKERGQSWFADELLER